MEQFPTTESDIQKVCRIARELDISIEEAAVTCDAFHLAFSDEGLRRSIFGIIDQLDESAARKGEPLGLIIMYTVEIGMDGIRVGRYADETPPGVVVELTPTNRAMIFLKIKDNFPTQEFLGPMIVNRPEWEFESVSLDCEFDAESPEQQFGKDSLETKTPNGFSPHRSAEAFICLGPIRLKLNERFPFLFAAPSKSRRFGSRSQLSSAALTAFAGPLPSNIKAAAASHLGQLTSGLSPPRTIGEPGTLRTKMFLRDWQ